MSATSASILFGHYQNELGNRWIHGTICILIKVGPIANDQHVGAKTLNPIIPTDPWFTPYRPIDRIVKTFDLIIPETDKLLPTGRKTAPSSRSNNWGVRPSAERARGQAPRVPVVPVAREKELREGSWFGAISI